MLTRFQSRLRAARSSDDGVTMAELTVTTLILGIVTAAVAGMIVSSMRVEAGVKERLDQSNAATIAMQRMSRNLRTAVLQSQLTTACIISACTDSAFLLGGPTSVQFYADVDNPKNAIGPSRVTYTVANGILTETVQKPDSPVPDANGYHYCAAGTNGCVLRTEVLATGVQTSTAVFTYYTAASPSTGMVMSTGNILSAAQLKTVDSIDITLSVVQPGGASVAGATMVQRVALPNADSVVRTDGN
jgi:type II secretory pathway pseudopilin PulG